MDREVKVSVIIQTQMGREYPGRFFEALRAQSSRQTRIMVVNSSMNSTSTKICRDSEADLAQMEPKDFMVKRAPNGRS